MQCPSVERTFCNLLYVYGRGRRRCGDPTIQADRFPLVGNAHRAFRGGKHGRMPFGQSTVKHEIGEYTLKHAAPVRRRAFRYNRVFLSAVGAGAPTLRFGRMRRKTKR